jgi:hypothetical protein
MVSAHNAGGTGVNLGSAAQFNPITVYVSRSTTATSFGWINPENGTIDVSDVKYIVRGSAGTGTIDVGTGTSGTGANNSIIDGGTVTAGVHIRPPFIGTVLASSTAGTIGITALSLAASGTGGDSIVANMSVDATLGTIYLGITYSLAP